jgi:hypothetical protein
LISDIPAGDGKTANSFLQCARGFGGGRFGRASGGRRGGGYTVKKGFAVFPSPSRDVTYQTLSGREYVSLIKPEVFPDIPFPSPEFSQNPFESDSVPVHRQEFSRIFLSPGGNFSKIFDNLFVYLFPA